jgi:endonuclease/exonuclease/phosphatase (EEP) superfamily protein YafD
MNKNQKKVPVLITFLITIVGCVLFCSGDAVNKYYQIHIPDKNNVVENYSGFSKKDIDPDSIKILIWNVYKEQKQGWAHDFKKVSKGMDIILIQEACLKENNKQMFCVNKMGWDFARSFLFRTKDLNETGVMTLSKIFPCSVDFIVTKFSEPFSRTPKVSLLNKYPVLNTKAKLLVVNIHGINFVGLNCFKSQIFELVKKIKLHKGPIVFAGDFNTWNYKRIFFLKKTLNNIGLKEIEFNPDLRTKRLGCFLDYAFYKGLKVKKTKVFNNIISSDHKALYVEFYMEET